MQSKWHHPRSISTKWKLSRFSPEVCTLGIWRYVGSWPTTSRMVLWWVRFGHLWRRSWGYPIDSTGFYMPLRHSDKVQTIWTMGWKHLSINTNYLCTGVLEAHASQSNQVAVTWPTPYQGLHLPKFIKLRAPPDVQKDINQSLDARWSIRDVPCVHGLSSNPQDVLLALAYLTPRASGGINSWPLSPKSTPPF